VGEGNAKSDEKEEYSIGRCSKPANIVSSD
jgi:hypothetical protein